MESETWVAISAGATSLMAIFTFVTILQSKKQIKELKKQWEEDHRARLVFSIVVANRGIYCLKVENIGTEPAYDIRISIHDNFLDKLKIGDAQETLRKLPDSPCNVAVGQSRYFYISPIQVSGIVRDKNGKSYTTEDVNAQLADIISEPIIINASYNGKYTTSEQFSIDSFTKSSMVVETPSETALISINSHLQKIANKI